MQNPHFNEISDSLTDWHEERPNSKLVKRFKDIAVVVSTVDDVRRFI